MPNQSIPEGRITEAWAEVRARDHVIRYRRAGAGRTVVLFISPDPTDVLWPGLEVALEGGFRIVVPERPVGGADVTAWLADFLEGLGTPSVAIVAAGCFCVAALELALLGVQPVSCLVLLPEGQGRDEGGVEGGLETAIGGSPVPLLIARRGQLAEEVLPLITAFLRGETAAPA